MGGNNSKPKPKNSKQAVQPLSRPPSEKTVANGLGVQPAPRSRVESPAYGRPDPTLYQPIVSAPNPDAAKDDQSSPKRSVVDLRKNTGSDILDVRELDDNIGTDDDVPVELIDNLRNKPKSRSSTRTLPGRQPTPGHRRQADVDSLSESHRNYHQGGSAKLHGKPGRFCSHCPHCRRRDQSNSSTSSTPVPKWLSEKPERNQCHIDMDEYDNEAVKNKVMSENGHVPGAYDYRPQLTIEQTNGYDPRIENYYTQPFVAKTTPRVSPTRTPFPEYNVLQRKERRVNKPYTLPLFTD